MFIVPPVVILAALLALVFFGDRTDVAPDLDADLCPVDAGVTERAVLLVDLVKPLNDPRLPHTVLREVTMDLERDAELRILALAEDAGAPREFMARLCKPYANADLTFQGAKDSASERRDCLDMPAQVSPPVRANAARFCELREAVAERMASMALVRNRTSTVRNAYLIEALEETNLEFAESAGPHALYVFSDMMQHAGWYSQPELGWEGWSEREFTVRRREQDALVGARPPHPTGVNVTLFYAPREGLTDRPRVKNIHKEFWRRYFAGVALRFRDQPLQPAYAVASMPAEPEPATAEPEPATAEPEPATAEPAVTCSVVLRSETQNANIYPNDGLLNYGDASIVVRFTINAQGETEDATVVERRSTAQRLSYFTMFAQAALDEVRNYRFDFEEDVTGCERRQQILTRIEFVH